MTVLKLTTPELQGLEKSKADQIKATFEPMAETVKTFDKSYAAIMRAAGKKIDIELIIKAKRLRLDISKIRIQTEKARKLHKEEYLRAGKAIDGVANILKWAVSDKEAKLKEIEEHYDRQEQERLDTLQADRVTALAPYCEDAETRTLNTLKEDEFEALLAMKKQQHEERLKAEAKAEEERLEAVRIAELEAQAKEAELKKLRQEAQARADEKLKEQAARDKAAKIQADKLAKERAAKEAELQAERDKAAKLEQEIQDRRAEDLRKAKELEDAAEKRKQEALARGDEGRTEELIGHLDAARVIVFDSDENKEKNGADSLPPKQSLRDMGIITEDKYEHWDEDKQAGRTLAEDFLIRHGIDTGQIVAYHIPGGKGEAEDLDIIGLLEAYSNEWGPEDLCPVCCEIDCECKEEELC